MKHLDRIKLVACSLAFIIFLLTGYSKNPTTPNVDPDPKPDPTTELVPEAPSDFAVTAISSSSIKLIWIDNSDDESGFIIERTAGVGLVNEHAQVSASMSV